MLTDTPISTPLWVHFHALGRGVRQATALESLPYVKDVMLNSEFTDSSPEVSLLNTKSAAG